MSIGPQGLDGSGLRGVRRNHGPTEHGGRISLYRPVLDDGAEPAEESLFLEWKPTAVRGAEREPELHEVTFERDGSCLRCQVRFPHGTSYYGTGEVAGPLLRNDRVVQLWNTDAWRYGEETPALYQSHPYVLAVLPDGRARGVIADSTRRGAIVTGGDGIELQFEGEPYDVIVLDGATPQDVTCDLASLIGTAPLPPRFALGYHQCRWSYMDAAEVRELAHDFRTREIPCDVIWLDIDYMDEWRVFSWNRRAFPDPKALTDELHQAGFRVIAMIDPGVAARRDDDVCVEGVEGGHFVRTADGRLYKGRVWPGPCYFPDFTRSETRRWWGDLSGTFVEEHGLDGLWNDMNEPSVFRVPTRTMAEDARHAGMGGGEHAKFHNVYGMLMSRATREGLERARPDRRPFVLTRSTFLGGARYAATWTGDNQAHWDDLRWSIAMTLNLGLCGQPFAGPDIGGFDGDPSPELFARWFELGAYLPFARGHGEKSSCRKEPWSFGEETEAHVRAALGRRMRLLPHLYTLFHEANHDGLPVARPVFFADPADHDLRAIDDAFLLGDGLLVAPVVEPGSTSRSVLLPSGGWYAFDDEGRWHDERELAVEAPLGTTPVFLRAGSIVPTGDEALHVGDGSGDITLHIALDRDGAASGALYEDAGDGVDHERDVFRRMHFRARLEGEDCIVETTATGTWDPGTRGIDAVVYRPGPGRVPTPAIIRTP